MKGDQTNTNDDDFHNNYRLSVLDNNKVQGRFGTGSGVVDLESISTLAAGQWYHLAYSVDSSTAKIYINGVLDNSRSTGGAVPYQQNEWLLIGSYWWKSAPFWYLDGLIDEVAIHNRALSASEIQAIYNAGSAGMCKIDADANKGHGNDPDGVDEDNPGQGCENKNENSDRKRCPS